MNELEKKLADFQAAEVEDKETFKVDSLEKANWCMKQIQAKERQKEELKQLVEYEKQKLEIYLAQESKGPEESIEFFKAKMQPYIAEKIAEGKKKSINLPCGTVGFRSSAPKFTFDDEKLKTFVTGYDKNLIETKTSVKWGELKKQLTFSNNQAVTEDGEVVPGIVVEEKEPIFFVKVEV